MTNFPPPPGFHGLRHDLPLTVTHQSLPHWRQDGATYFATIRLHDALPKAKLREVELLKENWERDHPEPREPQDWESLSRETMRRIDPCLDQGLGSCLLKSPEILQLVADALHRSHKSRCELGCYVVMPNHVHVILRPLAPETDPLEMILRHWKTSSARSIHEKLKTSGTLWHRESFDHIIRDSEQLHRIVAYILSNPSRAGLAAGASQSWISPDWVANGIGQNVCPRELQYSGSMGAP